jgi:phospholipase C
VEAGRSLADSWQVASVDQGRYDLSVFGPNGFLRRFRGRLSADAGANVEVECRYDIEAHELVLVITNLGRVASRITVANVYDDDPVSRLLRPGQSVHTPWSLKSSFGWYDLVVEAETDQRFLRRLAGHVEDGRDSASDPAIGDGDRTNDEKKKRSTRALPVCRKRPHPCHRRGQPRRAPRICPEEKTPIDCNSRRYGSL